MALPPLTRNILSLPPMGIGNVGDVHQCQFRHPGLTTPHGDRELPDDASTYRQLDSSLPPMGIGNAGRPSAPPGRTGGPLTTPHGDRERREDHRRDHSLRLTTPHGDRERPAWGWPYGPARTHYPPWGSGTRLRPHPGRLRSHLTTPHGDREPVLAGLGPAPAEVLTTPHGDRELGGIPPGGPDHHRSLPPMGIGNAIETVAGGRASSLSSLPPMGIGNFYYLLASQHHDLRLTTPHGDREPYLAASHGPSVWFPARSRAIRIHRTHAQFAFPCA